MKILLAGSIGRFPVGGHAWVDMQYLLGLRALGHDVYYLEECGEGSWVYNWATEQITTDLEYPTSYVRSCLETMGFGGRWIYRAGNQSVGMNIDDFADVCSETDLLIVRASPVELWRPEYLRPPVRIYIDSDPGFTQFALVNGRKDWVETVNRCERLFTIGQRLGAADCVVPTAGRDWIKTLPPIFLPSWPFNEFSEASHFTTVMQWRSYPAVIYDGISYGNKDQEFPKFIHLPRLTKQALRLALTGAQPEEFSQFGWDVISGWRASDTPSSYQDFVSTSRAELSIAKHGYVATRGGWFSDRSVCYLASGRPVLVEDTGLDDWLPIGDGIVTFRNASEAVNGIEAINADYSHHRRAARRLAETYFDTDRVLTTLLDKAMS